MGTTDEFKLSNFFCFVFKIDFDFPTIVDTKEMYGELPLDEHRSYSVDKPITGYPNPSLNSQFGSVHDCLRVG